MNWILIGSQKELTQELEKNSGLKELTLKEKSILLTYQDGTFGAISARCNHMKGPLVRGRLKKNGCVECPWHSWEFKTKTGEGVQDPHQDVVKNPGRLPSYPIKIENENVYIDLSSETARVPAQYNSESPATRVARPVVRQP